MAKFRTMPFNGDGYAVATQQRNGGWSIITTGFRDGEAAWRWAVGEGFTPHPLYEPAIDAETLRGEGG